MNAWILLDLLSIALALLALVFAWNFVWLYRREPWQDTVAGQHLMQFTTAIGVILTWTVGGVAARLIWEDADWLRVTLLLGRCGIFGWLGYLLWQRLKLLRDYKRNYTLQSVDTPVDAAKREEPA